MIQQDELMRLARGESDRIERTTSIKDTDKFSEAVTAFANDLPNHGLPGYLVIGVNDERSATGLEVTDPLLQTPGGRRYIGTVHPRPSPPAANVGPPCG